MPGIIARRTAIGTRATLLPVVSVSICVSRTTTAPGVASVAGSIASEKRTVISPFKPKPSSALTEALFGVTASTGALTVPSVLPFSRRSVG